MSDWSRRDVLKSAMAVPAARTLGTPGMLRKPAVAAPGHPMPPDRGRPGPRERLRLDVGWRFHFGHANDASKDFGFGHGREGGFQKTGDFLAPSHPAFDDSGWTALDLPHDWAIGLPFTNDPQLASKGSYPLGTRLPGDQRRLVPACPGAARHRRGAADRAGVRRRVPRRARRLQRLLHRPARRRL